MTVDASNSRPEIAPWRIYAWRVLVVLIPLGFAALTVNLARSAPAWSIAAACAAAALGVVAMLAISRLPSERKLPGQNGWLAVVAAGALGPLLAGAPDRIAVIPLAFLVALLSAGFWLTETRRRTVSRAT